MPSERLLYLGNDNLIVLEGLKDETTSANSFLTGSATVQMTLFDLSGNTVAGQSFPAAFTYDSDKGRGTFEGTLEDTLSLNSWQHYDLEINVSGSGIPTGKYTFRYYAVVRGMYGY